MLSLYVCLLQSKRSNPFTPAQPLLLQQSILGVGRKSYVPAELVSSPDVLPLQGFPKYWYDLAESSEFLPAADPLKCPIASPPVICWLCGAGFLGKLSLLKHIRQHHVDWAEYRKRLFFQCQAAGIWTFITLDQETHPSKGIILPMLCHTWIGAR